MRGSRLPSLHRQICNVDMSCSTFSKPTRRLEDAIEISRQICELEPQNPDHWLNLGLLNVRLERVGPAQEAIERAMQIAPDNPKVRQAYDLVREGM